MAGGGLITTGSVPKALWPGVHAFFGAKYNEHPTEYTQMFEVVNSKLNYEEDVLHTGFGYASVKNEGEGVAYASTRQAWTQRYTHVVLGLAYSMSREAVEDNQYKEVAMRRAECLAFSMHSTKELIHANHWNRATNTSYTGGDSKALMVSDHPTSGSGDQSNILDPAADLSEASLEDICVMVMTAKDDEGLQINLMPRSLHVAPAEWFEGNRILMSSLQNDTANNAVNALKSTNAIPDGIKVNHWFTSDTDSFFVRTNVPHGFMSFQRRALEFTRDNDFNTENELHKATERYISGWTNWRCCYGSPGA